MYSNQAFLASNVVQLPLPNIEPPQPKPAKSESRGWTYLMANSLAFKKEVNHGIRIRKPEQARVPVWISKLVKSGQCRTIYVEDLALPANMASYIEKLCDEHAVSLVNVSFEDARNIVVGPW